MDAHRFFPLPQLLETWHTWNRGKEPFWTRGPGLGELENLAGNPQPSSKGSLLIDEDHNFTLTFGDLLRQRSGVTLLTPGNVFNYVLSRIWSILLSRNYQLKMPGDAMSCHYDRSMDGWGWASEPLNHMMFFFLRMTIHSTTRVACNPSTRPYNHPSASPTRRGHLKVHVPFRSPQFMWVKLTYKQSFTKSNQNNTTRSFQDTFLYTQENFHNTSKHRRSSQVTFLRWQLVSGG